MSSIYSKNKIIIPLYESTNATDTFKEYNLIQTKSYEKIANLISKNLDEIKKTHNISCDTALQNRYHETITILGERGSGKTSFLLNLETKLEKYKDKLAYLKILDPTLFENKQHVMLTIISIILNKIEQYPDEQKNSDYKDKYIESLNGLAEGINLLDGIDSNINHRSIWEDARINFNKGIDSSKHGISFEEDFKKFVKCALSYINKKMFILIFDDIDTNIEKGWPVLEVIRKYLTMLEIQVIVSGDWALYSKVVRVNQFKNLAGLKDIEEECECKERYAYLKTLDSLEEQYLTKILKPENRIMLQSLRSLVNELDIYITPYHLEENSAHTHEDYVSAHPELNIEQIYKKILFLSWCTQKTTSFHEFKKLLLALPLRSNIQLFLSYENNKSKANKLDFIDDLGKQFLTQLTKHNISFHELNDFKETSAIYFYLKKSLEISYSSYTNISFSDFLNISSLEMDENQDKNLLFFLLRSYLTAIVNSHPFLTIEWMLKIELFKIYASSPFISYEKDLKYLGHGVPTTALQYVQRLNGYLLFQESEKKDTQKELDGFAAVYKDKSKKREKSYAYLVNQLESSENYNAYLILVDIMFNRIGLQRASKSDLFGSIYFILGFISEILSLENKENSVKEFMKLKRTRSGVMVFSISNNTTSISYEKDVYDEKALENNQLIEDLQNWLDLRDKTIQSFPLSVLEEAIKEFYLQESTMEFQNNFADYILLQIIYFFNALLKAVATQQFDDNDLTFKRIRQVSSAKKMLRENIAKYQKYVTSDQPTLFDLIYQCPIWNYFTNETQKQHEPINDQAKKIVHSLSLYDEDEETEAIEVHSLQLEENHFMQFLRGLKTHGADVIKPTLDALIESLSTEDEIVENDKNIEITPQLEAKSIPYPDSDFKEDTLLQIFNNNQEFMEEHRIHSADELSYVIEIMKNFLKEHYFLIKRLHAAKESILKQALIKYYDIA